MKNSTAKNSMKSKVGRPAGSNQKGATSKSVVLPHISGAQERLGMLPKGNTMIPHKGKEGVNKGTMKGGNPMKKLKK